MGLSDPKVSSNEDFDITLSQDALRGAFGLRLNPRIEVGGIASVNLRLRSSGGRVGLPAPYCLPPNLF